MTDPRGAGATDPGPATVRCEACHKPIAICVCDRIVRSPTRMEIVILQHPREPREDLGTARLLELSLARCRVVVGLSWPSLSAAIGHEARAREWGVLFPGKETPDADPSALISAVDARGERVAPGDLQGVLLLDGTWSQAKTLWWRNPWLLKLARLNLRPSEPSMYGRLRREPRREWVSTLEAVADTLVWAGEDPTVRTQLRKVLRTLLQRFRATEPTRGESRKR